MDTYIYYLLLLKRQQDIPSLQQSSDGNQNLFVKCDTDFNLQLVVKCEVVPNFILLISEWSMVVRTAAAGQRANINWVNAVQFHLADRI